MLGDASLKAAVAGSGNCPEEKHRLATGPGSGLFRPRRSSQQTQKLRGAEESLKKGLELTPRRDNRQIRTRKNLLGSGPLARRRTSRNRYREGAAGSCCRARATRQYQAETARTPPAPSPRISGRSLRIERKEQWRPKSATLWTSSRKLFPTNPSPATILQTPRLSS